MNRALLAVPALAIALLLGACGDAAKGPAAEPAAGATATQTGTTAQLVRADFAVEGMDCGGCVIGTRAALRKLDGVEQADASYEDATGRGTAWAMYDPTKVTPERLMAAIRELGYTPTLVDAGAQS